VARTFKLTRAAQADLDSIVDYTLRTWGENQCARYVDELEKSFQWLADNPAAGRACDDIRDGLRRLESGRHVVFFVAKDYGARIVRILHDQMQHDLHDMTDDDPAS
jgi:toxin ParE1/3/4